jgi:hypothetical protein
MAKKTERPHESTSLSLAPLTVDEALSALLKTPPPDGMKGSRKTQKTTKKAGKTKKGSDR